MAEEKYLRPKIRQQHRFVSYLQKAIFGEKLNNWVGYVLIAGIAGIFGFMVANNLELGVGLVGAVLGIIIIMVCALSTELGLFIIVAYSFLAYHFSRLLFGDKLPLGVVTDILVGVTFVGLFFGRYNLKQSTARFFKSSPVVLFSIVFIYLCLELANPNAGSFQGWFQIIRKVLDSLLLLYICYNYFTDYRSIWRFLKFLFVLAFIAGLYGCIQQWHGLFGFEENWVGSDQKRFDLIFILGNYRKFSFMSGPTEYGIIMAACAILFIIIGINQRKPLHKYVLLAGSFFMLLGMSYSGTRTANAMVVGACGIFILMTINKRSTIIFAICAVMAFLFLMYAPIYNNLTLLRFRSSFKAEEDASFNVREQNRASIQPYIHQHPFGGGLSTTGQSGREYNPGHPLAGFPPDSGYLNKALETGWVGLGLSCILYFVTLQYAIQGFFRSKNNMIKTLFAASSAFLFSFYLGEMVQEAVGQFTNMVVYYPVVAMVLRLRHLNAPHTYESIS